MITLLLVNILKEISLTYSQTYTRRNDWSLLPMSDSKQIFLLHIFLQRHFYFHLSFAEYQTQPKDDLLLFKNFILLRKEYEIIKCTPKCITSSKFLPISSLFLKIDNHHYHFSQASYSRIYTNIFHLKILLTNVQVFWYIC